MSNSMDGKGHLIIGVDMIQEIFSQWAGVQSLIIHYNLRDKRYLPFPPIFMFEKNLVKIRFSIAWLVALPVKLSESSL